MRWIILLLLCGSARALDGVILVRHAEKLEGWPAARELDALQPLSAEGVARAQQLATILRDDQLHAIYTSATTRSLQTALPTALAHGLTPEVAAATLQADRMTDWLNSLRERFSGPGWVLIVGHSNTVPLLLRALGVDERCDEALGIQPESYGPGIQGHEGMWRVDLRAEGCAAVQRSTPWLGP